jgi:hypothetical protein
LLSYLLFFFLKISNFCLSSFKDLINLNELNLDKTCLAQATTLTETDRTKLAYRQDKIVLPIPVTKPVTKQEKKDIHSAIDIAQEKALSNFEEFWVLYPVKKNKLRTKRLWDKKKLDIKSGYICDDIRKRKAKDAQWQDIQYIPHPSTYLNGEQWKDEIIEPVSKANLHAANELKIREREEKARREKDIAHQDARIYREIQREVFKREPGRPDGLKHIRAHLGLDS